MSEHDSYLDRMTVRLKALESEVQASAGRFDESQLRDVRAGLAAATERLQSLRRAGGELDAEMTQSFTQSFERLRASFGRLRGGAATGPQAA